MSRLAAALALAALLALALPARAEGPLSGGTRIYLVDHELGPFTLSSFAAPNPPVTSDRLWVTASLRDGARAVTDARVWISVTPASGGAPLRLEASHDLAASPLDYTAALEVPLEGRYWVDIEVEHPRASGGARYPVEVSRPLTGIILPLMAIPFVVIAFYLFRRLVRAPTNAEGDVE